MFFEKLEVKKALYLYNAVKKFAFKNQSDSKKTQRLHTVLSKKENDRLIIDEETSETGLGFVDKFVSIFNIRKKLEKARSEIKAKIGVIPIRISGEMSYTTDLYPFQIHSLKSYFYQWWSILRRMTENEEACF